MDNTQDRAYRDDLPNRDDRRSREDRQPQSEFTPIQRHRQFAVYAPLGEDVLLFHSMSATEQLARLFEYRVKVLAEDGGLDFAGLLGKNVSVRMNLPDQDGRQPAATSGDTRERETEDYRRRDTRDGQARAADRGGDENARFFNGYVSEIAQGTSYGSYNSYEFVLRPWLWFLTRTNDCRIFQSQSVPDIVIEVFRDNGFSDFKNRLTGSYRQREYCVQYRESDFDFISRLLEEEGIYYYFLHVDGNHILVLADDTQSCHDSVAGYADIPYYPPAQEQRGRDHIFDWSVRQKLQPGRYALNDFDFKSPRKKLLSSVAIPRSHAKSDLEIYDYPGEYNEPGDGEAYTRLRIEELQAQHETASGEGNARGLTVGALFNLLNCPREDQNRKYLVTSARYELRSDAYESEAGAPDEPVYRCKFTVLDARQPFRPARITPKPVVQGPQTAIVVGPGGEEIHTDQFGRVKCQFHWDRYGKSDGSSSCWIRVSQPWAGKGWGAVAIPRIGQEVVVDFLEGDADQPLITGRVYNADQMPPYALPGNKTQSGIKSRSSLGGGEANFNEIRFEDKIGSEEMYIHAEKDQNTVVENDRSTTVGRDKMESIGRNKKIEVAANHTESIGASMDINVSGSKVETVKLNSAESVLIAKELTVGGAYQISVGAAMNETVGGAKGEEVIGRKFETVGGTKTASVGGNSSEAVGGNKTVNISGDQSDNILGKFTKIVKKQANLKAKEVVIEAEDQMTLKAGGATIVMKKNGDILIKGKNISTQGSGKINIKASSDITIKGSKIKEN